MKKELDELLRHALAPMEEPDARLNREIIDRIEQLEKRQALPAESMAVSMKGQIPVRQEKKQRNIWKARRNRQSEAGMPETGMKKSWRPIGAVPAALAAALFIGVGSVTAIAAYKYLAPERIAEKVGDEKLAEAFSDRETIALNETQVFGRYQVTLLGIASGENISDLAHISDGKVREDRIYVVVAIEHADGSPMQGAGEPQSSQESQNSQYAQESQSLQNSQGSQESGVSAEEEEFFVSPLIRGFHPAFYNAASMHGNYTDILKDGVLYRLLECDNVEIFADRDLYLCVSEGSVFYNENAYRYDEETGEISRNDEFPGLNALFGLPMDTAAADPEKAKEYVENLGIEAPEIQWEKIYSQSEGGEEARILKEDGKGTETADENERGARVVEYALQFVGNPYEWNGESLTEGCDCSGFVKGVFEHFGISLPHSTKEQREYGEEVEGLDNAQPGDLIFYVNPSHVGIYIGDGNIVHADPQYDICVSEADYADMVMIRRLF